MKKPAIAIAALCLCAGVWAAGSARGDDFGQSVAQTLNAAGPGIKTSLKSVGAQKPPAATAVTIPFDSNVPKKLRDHVTRDLAFVAAIQGAGATKLHEQVFGAVAGSAYIKWFTERAKSVGYDPDEDDAIAYVDISTEPGTDHSKIWLAAGYAEGNRPQMARVDDVFHEARHTEDANKNWEHVDCPNPYKDSKGKDVRSIDVGKLAGVQEACDDTPVGAYGVAAIMLKNIQRFCASRGCTKKVRADAGLYSADDVKHVIGAQASQDLKADLSR
jgi:hypothetical protein